MSWTLRRRLNVSLTAAGLILLAVIALATALLVQVRHLQDRVVNDYFAATATGNDLFVMLLDAETAVRGYALTGDPSQLGPLQSPGTGQQGARTRELARLTSTEPALTAALQRAQVSAGTWFTDFSAGLVAEVQQGGPAAVRPGEIARGKVLFDQVRTDYAAFQDELERQRSLTLDRLQFRTNALFAVVLGSALVALAVAGLLLFSTRRWVTQPLDHLGEDVRRVQSGELDHEVSLTGPPEIAAVAGAVDDMRRSLVWRLAEVEEGGRAVEVARVRLEEQSEELARSNRDLEQFAYVASHDLQEPLRKVASFCQLLQRRYGGELDERADQYIEFAVDGAKRMQQLINDLLTFSRVGRTATNERAIVPLQASLDRAQANLAALLEETGAELTHDPLPEVHGEAGLLAQLLQNLIGNAVKFRGEQVPRVQVTCRRDGEAYELAVIDNGIGIEPQYADRVFVIFQRLHAKEAYAGTGIGLAMCKRIVEHHSGRIWIDSAPAGGGTAVRFTLPVPDLDLDLSPEPDPPVSQLENA